MTTLIEKVITEVKQWTIERRRMGSHEPRHDELLVEECERLAAENAKLRASLVTYSDHSKWCCLDHNVVGCDFCEQSDFIVLDGDDCETPGWKMAEDCLR